MPHNLKLTGVMHHDGSIWEIIGKGVAWSLGKDAVSYGSRHHKGHLLLLALP